MLLEVRPSTRLHQAQVRCDGNLDGCRNCVRLCLECSFEAKEDPQTATRRIHLHNAFPELYTQAGTARKRARMACKACNSHKLRCSSNTPACQRCLKKQIECEYPVLGGAQGSSASPSGADRASVVPGRDGARIGLGLTSKAWRFSKVPGELTISTEQAFQAIPHPPGNHRPTMAPAAMQSKFGLPVSIGTSLDLTHWDLGSLDAQPNLFSSILTPTFSTRIVCHIAASRTGLT